jgi:hypothetical protein
MVGSGLCTLLAHKPEQLTTSIIRYFFTLNVCSSLTLPCYTTNCASLGGPRGDPARDGGHRGEVQDQAAAHQRLHPGMLHAGCLVLCAWCKLCRMARSSHEYLRFPPLQIDASVHITKHRPVHSVLCQLSCLKYHHLTAIAAPTATPQVWNSQDTQSQAQVALWYPSLQVSMMTSTKVSSPRWGCGLLTVYGVVCLLWCAVNTLSV